MSARGRAVDEPKPIDSRALTTEIDLFLLREATAHFAAIPTLDPPPARVLGARTVGEFSWGTFMRALAAIAQHRGQTTLAGRDVPQWIGRMGLVEARAGSKAFSQMYAALALQHYGENLDQNAVWQRLSPAERDEWRSLLDVRRFYDPVNRRVIDLPENYLGVASRVGAIGYRLGLTRDRAPLDALIDRAVEPFNNGRLYSDDAPPNGRFDRYSNEYARYVWDAATQANRPDILAILRPSLTSQMRLAGSAAVRAADHDRHAARRRRLSACAARPVGLRGAGRAGRAGARPVPGARRRPDDRGDRWRRRNSSVA